jgi:hypothetical protein
MLLLQLLAMSGFGIVAYQDFKDRTVLWILFPIIAVLLILIHSQRVAWESVLFFSGINLLLVGMVLCILWLYTKWIMKVTFLNHAIGLGDILFLIAFATGFPTVTFIILLVGSLLFSIAAYSALRGFFKMETIPLAGLMGIFLIGVLLFSNSSTFPSLYII